MPLKHYIDGSYKTVRTRDIRLIPEIRFPVLKLRHEALIRQFADRAITEVPSLAPLAVEAGDVFDGLPPPVGESEPSSSSAPSNPEMLQRFPCLNPENSAYLKAKPGRPGTRMPAGWEYEA